MTFGREEVGTGVPSPDFRSASEARVSIGQRFQSALTGIFCLGDGGETRAKPVRFVYDIPVTKVDSEEDGRPNEQDI